MYKMFAYYEKHLDYAKSKIQLFCANCNWIKRELISIVHISCLLAKFDMADKFVPREQYKTLEKVADEMFVTLKAVISQLQQTQASQSMLIAQLSNYINKIETEKNKPEPSQNGNEQAEPIPSPEVVS